jgi:hypothetical protein
MEILDALLPDKTRSVTLPIPEIVRFLSIIISPEVSVMVEPTSEASK